MRILVSLVKRTAVGAFHAFVRSRLQAEMGNPEFVFPRNSAKSPGEVQPAPVENKPPPKPERPVRKSPAAPIPWAGFAPLDMPTIGVL